MLEVVGGGAGEVAETLAVASGWARDVESNLVDL